MLVLVALVESAITRSRPDLATPWADDWRFAAEKAVTEAPRRELLCFGDSLVKYGVLPQVIARRTGLRSYNLATSGGTLPSSYFLLKHALNAGARPRAVVVDFTPLLLPEPAGLQNYPELATWRDCLDLAWTARDPGFLAAASLAKLLPSYRWRFEARGAIKNALGGKDGSPRPWVEIVNKIWLEADGAQPMPRGRARPSGEDALIDGVAPPSWTCGPTDRAFLERFLALAESRKIPVFWLIPPLCPEAHARRARRGSDAAYTAVAREISSRYRDVIVVDARHSGYDDSVHSDHLHLDGLGAEVLSSDLGAVVSGWLASRSGPRWVDLPAYAGRQGGSATEALARSSGEAPR
jgi:hypothetical protein